MLIIQLGVCELEEGAHLQGDTGQVHGDISRIIQPVSSVVRTLTQGYTSF